MNHSYSKVRFRIHAEWVIASLERNNVSQDFYNMNILNNSVDEMIKQKMKKLLMFVAFTVITWILCIAYAISNLGE
jgi:hypothetical protein